MDRESLVVSIMVRRGRKVVGSVMKGARVAIGGISKGSSTRRGITNSPPGQKREDKRLVHLEYSAIGNHLHQSVCVCV